MKGRDALRFVLCVLTLTVIHTILFDMDGDDMTQIWVFAGVFTLLAAIREQGDTA